MERIGVLKNFLTEEKDFLVKKRLNKIEDLYKNKEKSIGNRLEITLKKLVSEKEKGILAISYLRSSYITESHEFYIAYYFGDVFVEEEPDCVYFSMYSLFEAVKEDWIQIDKKLDKNFVRVFMAEKKEIHRWYMKQLYESFDIVLKLILEDMKVEKGIDVYFGGFMDEVKLIGRI